MSGVAVLVGDGNGNGGQGEGGIRGLTAIPSNMKKTIQNIREITGKQHSDDDIYAVLKECSMDPNETAQKLLYLDTFHEVKKRRDRRKENLSSRKPEGSRSTQGRFARGGQDNVGRKNVAVRRENGINHITKNNSAPLSTKASAVIPNGPTNLSNGSVSHSPTSQTSVGGVINVPKGSSAVDVNKLGTAPPQYAAVAALAPAGSASGVKQGKSPSGADQLSLSATPATVSAVDSSASVPVLIPAIFQHPGPVSTAKQGTGSQGIATEPSDLQKNKHISRDVSELELSKNEKAASRTISSMNKKRETSKSKVVQKNKVSETLQPSSSASEGSLAIRSSSDCASQSTQESVVPNEVIASDVATTTVEVISEPPAEVNVNDRQIVTFPNHFQVSEALKSGLTFGSFESTFGSSVKSIKGTGGDNDDSSGAVESSQQTDQTAKEHSSNQIISSNAPEDFPDHPNSVSQPILEQAPPPEGNVSSAEAKDDQLNQEILSLPEVPQNPTIQNGPNYNLGLVSTMLGNQFVQFEGPEIQTQEASRFSNFVNGNTPAVSSRSPTPPIQSSVPPQSVPVLRQPYPANFIPYGHYYHPFYMPPIHQYLSHNGFPQQPSTGNVYLTPAPNASAAGVKPSLPQLKPGANAGNPAHIGIFGSSFIAPPVGHNPGSAVTSGSSTGIKDLSSSQMKENHVYTTGQLSEGSTVWIPGQDIPNLPVNSLYNFNHHGQPMAFSLAQAGHGAFAGLYAGQTLAAPSTLLQQSQAMAGAVETVAPPTGVFQQAQHPPINWISNF